VGEFQLAFFFTGVDQRFSVVLIVSAAANLALLDQQFKAVIAERAVIDLFFPALPDL